MAIIKAPLICSVIDWVQLQPLLKPFVLVYQGYLLNCSGGNPNSEFYYEDGFFIENAIVPLASFEGNHLTYPVVRENYMVNNVVKYYTLYRYTNEAVEPFSGIPTAPIQPRIASGQLARKEQWNEATVKVASEENTGYADLYDDYSYGKFIKFNTYSQGLAGGNPISFWKKYKIRNRPYRLASTTSVVDAVSSTTTYGYDNQNNFLAPTEVTTTNSEGSTQNVKTYYALICRQRIQIMGFKALLLINS